MSSRLGAIAAITLVAGCNSVDQVVGRYASATCEEPGILPRPCNTVISEASVSVVAIKTPGTDPIAGTSLPERALAAYIAVLGSPRLSATAKDLRANLAAKLSSIPDQGPGDNTLFHRTIIVTVARRGAFNPADRLEATEVVIRLDCESTKDGSTPLCIRFTSWDTAATAYTTISAGTVGFTQARSAELDPSVGTPPTAPVSASVGGKFSTSSTRAETFNYSTQVESLTVSVEEDGHSLRIRRQGGTGIDLTGNTVVKVDIALDTAPNLAPTFTPKDGYSSKAGNPLPASLLKLIEKDRLVPPVSSNITAKVSLQYTLRHITAGDGTGEERDDVVVEKTVVKPEVVSASLIPAREVANGAYAVYSTHQDNVLHALPRGRDKPTALCFTTHQDAFGFLTWQRSLPAAVARIGNIEVGFPTLGALIPLGSSELGALMIVPHC